MEARAVSSSTSFSILDELKQIIEYVDENGKLPNNTTIAHIQNLFAQCLSNPNLYVPFYNLFERHELLFKLAASSWFDNEFAKPEHEDAGALLVEVINFYIVLNNTRPYTSMVLEDSGNIAPPLHRVINHRGSSLLHLICERGYHHTAEALLSMLFHKDNYRPALGIDEPYTRIRATDEKYKYKNPSEILVAFDGALQIPYFLARLHNHRAIIDMIELCAKNHKLHLLYRKSSGEPYADAKAWLSDYPNYENHSSEEAYRALQNMFSRRSVSCEKWGVFEIILTIVSATLSFFDAIELDQASDPRIFLSLELACFLGAIRLAWVRQRQSSKQLEDKFPVQLKRKPLNFNNLKSLFFGIGFGFMIWVIGGILDLVYDNKDDAGHKVGSVIRIVGPLLFQCLSLVNSMRLDLQKEHIEKRLADHEKHAVEIQLITTQSFDQLKPLVRKVFANVTNSLVSGWAASPPEGYEDTSQFRLLGPSRFMEAILLPKNRRFLHLLLQQPEAFSKSIESALTKNRQLQELFNQLSFPNFEDPVIARYEREGVAYWQSCGSETPSPKLVAEQVHRSIINNTNTAILAKIWDDVLAQACANMNRPAMTMLSQGAVAPSRNDGLEARLLTTPTAAPDA